MKSAAFWDKAAAKYAKDPISNMAAYTQTRDRMREVLQPDHSVIELGCGTGSTALELADAVASYTATDVSPKMIEIAKAKQSADTPSKLHFDVAAAGTLPPGPFDVVLALNLLHLLPDLETVLAEIHKALPPGGRFISKTALLQDGPFYIRMLIPLMRAIGKAPFVRCLRQAELTQLLEAAGFDLTETLLQEGTINRLFVIAAKR